MSHPLRASFCHRRVVYLFPSTRYLQAGLGPIAGTQPNIGHDDADPLTFGFQIETSKFSVGTRSGFNNPHIASAHRPRPLGSPLSLSHRVATKPLYRAPVHNPQHGVNLRQKCPTILCNFGKKTTSEAGARSSNFVVNGGSCDPARRLPCVVVPDRHRAYRQGCNNLRDTDRRRTTQLSSPDHVASALRMRRLRAADHSAHAPRGRPPESSQVAFSIPSRAAARAANAGFFDLEQSASSFGCQRAQGSANKS